MLTLRLLATEALLPIVLVLLKTVIILSIRFYAYEIIQQWLTIFITTTTLPHVAIPVYSTLAPLAVRSGRDVEATKNILCIRPWIY